MYFITLGIIHLLTKSKQFTIFLFIKELNMVYLYMVKHVQKYPGHAFNPREDRLLWATRYLYISQLVETSCIKLFLSCNQGPGDVSVSRMFASFCVHLAGINDKISMPLLQDHTQATHISSVINVAASLLVDTASWSAADAARNHCRWAASK